MAKTSQEKLQALLNISNLLIDENDYQKVIEKIINFSKTLCNADSCFFYQINDDKFLSLEYSYIEKLNLKKYGSDNLSIYPTIYIPDLKLKAQKSLVEQCAYNKEVINCPNIFEQSTIDRTSTQKFDDKFNYSTLSALTIPLISRKGDLVGVVELINAKDSHGRTTSFNAESQSNAQSICNLASILLENNKLNENYGRLLESFIEVIARAIDAKSPYTGAHCQRVPVIAKLLATAAVSDDRGLLEDFEITEDNLYSLHIASWLHDCGKVTTPDYIVDKATKLETINNRIHEIRTRFEILKRDAHIEYLQDRLANTNDKESLQKDFLAKVLKLEDDFKFIAQCNTGDILLTDSDVKRLKKLSTIKYSRHFNKMLGLSWAERDRVSETKKIKYSQPAEENLLQNLPSHFFNNIDKGELYNLTIRSGTINKGERARINDHINVTIDMLKAMPFPKELSNVVEYAGCHHERVDGKGYPNGLTGDQMSIPAKIMTIADIFEALTANDRPYKDPKKLSEVLSIMKYMKNSGHIDPILYDIFITHKVYLDYAEQYIDPLQIDTINNEEYL